MKSRRIIHVANFGLKPVRVYLHNTAMKLSNGWIRAGHHVINFSDRDIARWNSFLGNRKFGARAVNKLLLEACRNFQPDVMAFGHADLVTPETLQAIRVLLPQAKMLQWNIDWIFPDGLTASPEPGAPASWDISARDNRAKIESKQKFVDATFLTSAGKVLQGLAKSGHSAAFMPNPVDFSIERACGFERADQPYDVFFPANAQDDRRFHCGAWRSMDEVTRSLQAALPDIAIFTPGLGRAPRVLGPAYDNAISQCRIGLNISRRNDSYLYSSDRLAHLIGNGLAVCIERGSGYADIFGEDEMVFYASEAELVERLAALKRDDALRKRIAERGWHRYGALFDSRIIAQYMLDVVYGEHDAAKYPWPTVAVAAA